MPTINDIRVALANTLKASISGIQISPWLLGGPTPPVLQIVSGPLDYDGTFGASAQKDYQFKVQGMIGLATDIGAQKRLGDLSDPNGPKSVWAAIAADHTLGGVVLFANVISASEEMVYNIAAERPQVIGREWIVEIEAPGA